MKLIISSVSGEPIYEQIKNQIRSAVMSGELEASMGQYGLNNGDVPDSVLGFCNRQQVIAHLYLMFYR